MVKIRLKRMGSKGRPFYRIVIANSLSSRDGVAKEVLGTYDPLTKPSTIKVNEERALYWLGVGAQPTETVAYLLNKQGILEKHFESRPTDRKKYGFLNKQIDVVNKTSVDV